MRLIVAMLPLSGCIIEVTPNDPPWVLWAEASCGADPYGQWSWSFDAQVTDPDSPWDVLAVDAHVYDGWWGLWVDSFALQRTDDPEVWHTLREEEDTALYCGDPYLIDFVALDSEGAADVYTVEMPWFY